MKYFKFLALFGVTGLLFFSNFLLAEYYDNYIDLNPMSSPIPENFNGCHDYTDDGYFHLYIDQDEDRDGDGREDLAIYMASNFKFVSDLTWDELNTQFPYHAVSLRLTETNVKYYTPESSMLYKLENGTTIASLDDSFFYRASRAFPYLTAVRGMSTYPHRMVFEIPNNPNNNTVDFIYDYHYKLANSFIGGTTLDYWYNSVSSMFDFGPATTYINGNNWPNGEGNKRRSFTSNISERKHCRKFTLHRCGDGIVDDGVYDLATNASEQCDDGNTNNNDTCTNTCQINEPNDPPVCELTFDGNPATNISINNGDTVAIQCDGENANMGRYARNAANYPISTMFFGSLPVGGDITFTQNQDYIVQCQVKNADNNLSDICEATISVSTDPSSCTVNIQEDSAYIYADGSFDPNPIHVNYDVDGADETTIQTNIPGATNNHNATVNIVSNLENTYYINILDANGVQVAQCSDTIDLNSCGDNQLQSEYEQCEVNTLIMPAPAVINNLEALLPDYLNDFSKKKIGGAYAALFDRKKEVRSESTIFNDTRALRATERDIKQPIPSDLDGCSATCQLEEPTCRVEVGPGEVSAGERAYFSGQTQEWSTFLTLDYEEGGPTYNFANSFPGGLPVVYFHFDSGVYYDGYDNPAIGYSYMATVENARGMGGSRQLINPNAIRPENICGGDTSVNEILVNVDKSLLQEGTVFMSGDDVGFQIIVTNDSSGRVYGLSVTDYFSALLEWDGNIEIEGLGDNTVVTDGIVSSGLNLQWITVSNIDLAPMSTGAIYLTGRMYSHLCNWPNTGVLTGDALDGSIWFGASFPCGPVADIQKFQSTGTSLDSFTQELIQVEIGDSLNYRVEFANNGGTPTIGGVTIRDYLPEGITYVGSEIFVYTGGSAVVPTPLYTEQGTVGNQDYIIYSGFDLASEQSGYIMIYGEVSDNMNYFVYENTTELEFANPYQSGVSNTVVAVRGDVPLVDFQKNIINGSGNILTSGDNTPYFFSGDEILFEISIENLGDAISGIVVDDIRPDVDQNCVSYSGWESVDAGRSWVAGTWTWTYGSTLPEFGQTSLILIGEVIGGQECVGSYVNTGLLQYYQNGILYTGEDEAAFEIRDANMLLTKTADSSDVSVGSEITFFLYFENNGSHTISNFVLTDLRPATLALQPSLTHPKPYTYIGPGNPSFSPPQAIDGGRELQWNRGNQEFLPGMTGMIILTGIVLDAQEAIELYEQTH